jgi:hypothetical protein
MTPSGGIALLGFGILIAGICFLAWTFGRGGNAPNLGVALIVCGFAIQIAAVFLE